MNTHKRSLHGGRGLLSSLFALNATLISLLCWNPPEHSFGTTCSGHHALLYATCRATSVRAFQCFTTFIIGASSGATYVLRGEYPFLGGEMHQHHRVKCICGCVLFLISHSGKVTSRFESVFKRNERAFVCRVRVTERRVRFCLLPSNWLPY